MNRRLTFAIARIVAAGSVVVAVVFALPARAQAPLPTTPGLPWTYLPDATFTTADSAILHHKDSVSGYTLRYVYKLHYHPELMEIVDGKISVELPRNPGESEVVAFNRARIDTSYSRVVRPGEEDTSMRVNAYGYTSDSYPAGSLLIVYRPEQVVLGERNWETLFSDIGSAPRWYEVFRPVIYDSLGLRVALFFQFTDPVYHPPISSMSESYAPLPQAPYPSPCTDRLHFTAPEAWAGHRGEVVVVAAGGRVVHRASVIFASGPDLLPREVVGSLPVGAYAIILRNPKAKQPSALGRFVKQ